jgi:hypothetical protein
MSEKYAKESVVAVGPDSSSRVFVLSEIANLTPTYFLHLRLYR